MGKKIFITGPSGIGKTTLANYISDTYGIPFINTSAREIWPKYGIKSHAQAHMMCSIDSNRGLEYQTEILTKRVEALEYEEEFICDRSPIDNLVYFMLELSPYVSQYETEKFVSLCKTGMELGNKILILPFLKEIRLSDHRINNPFYQQMVNQMINWIIYSRDFNIHNIEDIHSISMWDLSIRKQSVDLWLKS